MSSTSDRGQSAPLGVALLLGMTLIGTTAVVAFGSVALTDTQESSELAGAEQSMTLFDSQTAQVALGESSNQKIDFGQSDGSYDVKPSAGEISIVQLDCDDNDSNDDGDNVGGGADGDPLSTDDDAYILSPTDLGSVVYDSGERTLAYQGGGVWKKADNGGSVMVSPPEFHYRGATLTLPIVLTEGHGSVSGAAKANVKTGSRTTVFPLAGSSFPTRCGSEPYENPISDGRVIVRVESEYADAWGSYFETRTEGDVNYPADDVVTVELVSLGNIGDFGMPGSGSSVTVSGATGSHSTKEFKIRLRPDDTDSANFDNLQWSMYAEESSGDKRFEIHLKKGSGSSDCSDGSTDLKADLTIYYSADGGDTYQGWHADDAFEAECKDFDGDSDWEIYLDAEFVDDEEPDGSFIDDDESDDPSLQYVDKSGMNNLVHFSISGSDMAPAMYTMDGHGDWESKDYDRNSGDSDDAETVDRIVNHYFAELPTEFDLTVKDKGSNTVQESDSSGHLTTGGGGRYVTYLHVTTNEVEVEVD